MKNGRSIFVAAIAFLCVQGCVVGPDYHTPATTMPGSFSSSAPTSDTAGAADVTRWWKSLNDSELNRLVDRAVQSNFDLQMAVMRLQQAREQEFAVAGFAWPEIEAAGGAGRGSGTNSVKGRIPGPLNAGTNTTGLTEITYVGGADGAWDVDLFGGLTRELEAARYDRQAAAEARNDVLITLISDVANAYVDDRGAQLRLAIAGADMQAEQQSYDLVDARYTRGFTNELDPALAQRQLRIVQAQVAPLRAAIQQDQRHLAVLLGRLPDDLNAELSTPAALPNLPPRIEPGLPIDLLRRRPDIRRAERQLAAATARIGVATDALYPHVILTAGAGLQGQGLGRLPNASSFDGSIGPEAYWPLLDFGTLDALVNVQDYHTRELLLNYQQTVLTAVQEVDDAISNYQAQQDRVQSLAGALAAAQRAVSVASQRYDRGFTNFLDVLDSQRELYALQDEYAAAQEDVLLQYIALYKALGGGWEHNQTTPPARQPQPAVLAAVRRIAVHDDFENPTQK